MVKPSIKFFLVLASTWVTLASDISFSQSSKPAAVPAQEVVARVNEYMDALAKLNRFGGTILIARDGRVPTSSSYGKANLEDDVANARQTKFHLASITKTFTAMAVVMLQQRGKLSVRDP